MIHRISIILFLFTSSFYLSAQKNAIKSITEAEFKAHLEFIASDLMQGRDFGTPTPGLELTARYIKAQCADMGLKPAYDDYFQKFNLLEIKAMPDKNYIRIKDDQGNLVFESKEIFSPVGIIENIKFESNVVFAGYGWSDSKKGYNDLEGINLKEKIVMIMTRNPDKVKEKEPNKSDAVSEFMKINSLFTAGAKSIIIVNDPMNPDKKGIERFVRSTGKASYTKKGKINLFGSIKLFYISEKVANSLLSGTGETLENLQKKINETGKPASFEIINRKAEINMEVLKGETETKNIVGVIEGSHPVLKNECIVFTAHYDHVGITQDGEVYNGADDNASGSVALLEIAEAFMKSNKKPKRSIVFAWVTAEEKGLYGSEYYSENPLFPLDKTLTNINLDMVGRSAEKELEKVNNENKSLAGPNGIYLISGKQSTELMDIAAKYCRKLNFIASDELTKPFLNRSDYYHFHKHGIPVLGVSTGLHDDYHQVTDEENKIDYTKMRRIAQFCYLVANEISSKTNRIVVDKPSKK